MYRNLFFLVVYLLMSDVVYADMRASSNEGKGAESKSNQNVNNPSFEFPQNKENLNGNKKIGHSIKSVLSDIKARGITRANARASNSARLSNPWVGV